MLDLSGIGIVMAFAAGLVSFLSPCVLPLVPGYVSFVAGRSLDDLVEGRPAAARVPILALALCFVVGFSAVFVALGASASAIGGYLRSYLFEANYVAAAVIIVFGLHMTGLLRLGWMNRDWRFGATVAGGRPVGAFLLGSAFAFGWTPCIGPVLGAILTLGAATADVNQGMTLLAVYALGLAVPFLLVAAFTGHFVARMKILARIGRPLQAAAGGFMVLVGIAMATGTLTRMGSWLLATFPGFQDILL